MTIPFGNLDLYLNSVAKSIDDESVNNALLAATIAAGVIRETVMDLFPSGRTGNLSRSFKPSFVSNQPGGETVVAATSSLVYAEIQDQGGRITAGSGVGNAKAMAVPVGGRLGPVGKWPRHFAKGELTYIARKGAPPLLVKKRKTRWDIMFILKRSVYIPGKRYLDEAEQRMLPELVEFFTNKFGESFDVNTGEVAEDSEGAEE